MIERGLPFRGYRRALSFAYPYWPRLLLILVVGILATSFGLAQPYISKLLIDNALLRKDLRTLIWVSGLMIAVTVLNFALNILSSYQYVRVSANVLFDMRLALYRHLQMLSPRFWARTRMGDVISRINNDLAEVQRVSADSLLSVVSNIVFLFGSAAVMAALNARIFLLSVIVLPVSLWALHHYQARLTTQVRAVRERSADIGSFLLETLLGVRVVVTANAEAREVARFRRHNQSFLDALLQMQLTSFLSGAVPGTVITLCTSALFLYGGKLVIDGKLSTGSLVALMAYHARLLAPIQNLMSLYTNLISGGVALQRVWELFDTVPVVQEKPNAKALTNVQGDLECDNISFRHGEKVVFENLSFRVPAGTICAVIGPSGIGKSTLADLLVRFYDPAGGTLRLDGEDLRDVRLSDLRSAVILLDQQPYLFNTSVRENIAYGRPDASDADIIEAARKAEIHTRIETLPEGYDTLLAERGQTLSAGERQRIALARALLANPRVLVLDEPTSALDEANEKAIADTLVTALAGRTAIFDYSSPLARPHRSSDTSAWMSGRKRVKVGIVDSGITPGHPHVGEVAGGMSFVTSAPPNDIIDRLGHGTAVAGAIREAAPEADLYALKIFDRRLSVKIESLLAALEWCVENHIDVVNLSLGTSNSQYRDAFADVINHGLLAVSVAELLPGCLPGVIAVGIDQQCPRGSFRFAEGIFFASPYARPIPGVPVEHNLQGSSFAVANMTGIVARFLIDTPPEQVVDRLKHEAVGQLDD